MLVALGYAILGLGVFISQLWLQHQTNRLDAHQKAIEASLIQVKRNAEDIKTQTTEFKRAVILFCEVSNKDDAGERKLLFAVSEGQSISVSAECLRLEKLLFR